MHPTPPNLIGLNPKLLTLASGVFNDRRDSGTHPDAFNSEHARTLYMLGMRDLITCLDAWKAANIPVAEVAVMLECIYNNTNEVEYVSAH